MSSMTRWYAVKNDVVGGWAVANRQVPVSELDTRQMCKCGHQGWVHDSACARCACTWFEDASSGDVVIADGVKSEADARRIAAALNFMETGIEPGVRESILEMFSVPWPDAEAK